MIPIAFDDAQLRSGGIHWSWDSTKPTYFGVLRRGGDGKDLQWIEGPTRSATHVMGAFSDGEKVYVDVEMSMSNPFPFVPMRDGSQWNPIAGTSHIMRLSADLSRGRARASAPRLAPCAPDPLLHIRLLHFECEECRPSPHDG